MHSLFVLTLIEDRMQGFYTSSWTPNPRNICEEDGGEGAAEPASPA